MKPVEFDGCFGWLHRGHEKRGVLMCGPLGEEGHRIHRTWRELAERLSMAGLSALRFDYLGTGDSAEDSKGIGQIETWLRSIELADRFLRSSANVESLTLVGFRFGSLLATMYAERFGGIDGIALLAPLSSGRAYLRELTMMRKLAEMAGFRQPTSSVRENNDVEIAGVSFSGATVKDLEDLELLQCRRKPTERALILLPDGTKDGSSLFSSLLALGVDVQKGNFSGHPPLLWEPWHVSHYQSAGLETVVRWIAPREPTRGWGEVDTSAVDINVGVAVEQAISFGLSDNLFGVFCRPREASAFGSRPALLFLNTGPRSHIGWNRMWVRMARRYASQGFSSLRFDILGVGDSAQLVQDNPGDPSYHSLVDMRSALDWLLAAGFPNVVVVAHCAGAALAYGIAASDARIVGQVLINPYRQFWSERRSSPPMALPRYYLRRALRWSIYLDILKGSVSPKILVRGIGHLIATILTCCIRAIRRILKSSFPSAPKQRPAVSVRGISTLLIYGDHDYSLSDYYEAFGSGVPGMATEKRVNIQVLDNVGHAIDSSEDMERVMFIVAEHLRDNHGGL